MNSNLIFDFSIDKENKTITVKREFAAPLQKVWAAWTESKILDQWWAPKPWKANTKTMDFKDGGYWFYSMNGPNGETQWSRADFESVDNEKSFSAQNDFTDENGNVNSDMPGSNWTVSFNDSGDKTTVNIHIQYNAAEDLEKEIEMGFKEGFSMGLGNLDALLDSQK